MFSDRFKAFFFNLQTIYWLLCFLALTLFFFVFRNSIIYTPFDHEIVVSSETAPGLIILSSLAATSLWCYLFMLIPVMRQRILPPRTVSSSLFHILFITALLFNLLIFVVYWSALTEMNPISGATGSDVVKKAFDGFTPIPGDFLRKFHLLIYVLFFCAMDVIVSRASTDVQAARRFTDVIIFVNIPIIGTMVFIIFLLEPILQGQFYYFEAGMVAFQLIAGSFSVIGLELLEEEISRAKGEEISPAAKQIDAEIATESSTDTPSA